MLSVALSETVAVAALAWPAIETSTATDAAKSDNGCKILLNIVILLFFHFWFEIE
jgi:hypothetical protein